MLRKCQYLDCSKRVVIIFVCVFLKHQPGKFILKFGTLFDQNLRVLNISYCKLTLGIKVKVWETLSDKWKICSFGSVNNWLNCILYSIYLTFWIRKWMYYYLNDVFRYLAVIIAGDLMVIFNLLAVMFSNLPLKKEYSVHFL